MNLLIEGVFDVFHDDHRKYIERCIQIFKDTRGSYPVCLRVNVMSNTWANRKGIYRPFFDEEIRRDQVADFLQIFKATIPKLELCISNKTAFEYSSAVELKDVYPDYQIALCLDNKQKNLAKDYRFLEVASINSFHTTDIEARILDLKESSNNRIRKVAAVVVKHGRVIGEGVSVKGDSSCLKCTLFDKGKIEEARSAACNHPHAEVTALNSCRDDLEAAALIVTTAPCPDCARYIMEKKMGLVIYLDEYVRIGTDHNDQSGIEFLRRHGVVIRKAGV